MLLLFTAPFPCNCISKRHFEELFCLLLNCSLIDGGVHWRLKHFSGGWRRSIIYFVCGLDGSLQMGKDSSWITLLHAPALPANSQNCTLMELSSLPFTHFHFNCVFNMKRTANSLGELECICKQIKCLLIWACNREEQLAKVLIKSFISHSFIHYSVSYTGWLAETENGALTQIPVVTNQVFISTDVSFESHKRWMPTPDSNHFLVSTMATLTITNVQASANVSFLL